MYSISFMIDLSISTLKFFVLATIGMTGGYIASVFGGWDIPLQTLLIFMCLDVVAGLLLAKSGHSKKSKSGYISSETFTDGLLKKGFTLIIVLVGVYLDNLIGLNIVRNAVILGFIAAEGISLTEHAITAGVKMPAVVTDALEIINQKSKKELKESLEDLAKKTNKENKE